MLSERSQMQQGAYCMFHLHEDQEQTKPIYGGKKNEKPPPHGGTGLGIGWKGA